MILGFALEECRRLAREPFRFLLFVAPWIALAVSLSVYSGRVVRELPTGILDQDQTALSRSLVRALDATPQLSLQSFSSQSEMMDAFREGRIRGGILLPEGLTERTREGKSGQVVVWRDASNPLYSNQVFQAASGVVAMEGAKLEAGRLMGAGIPFSTAKDLSMLIRLDSRPLGNPFIDYLSNMAPGLLPVFLQLCLMLAGGNMLPQPWKATNHPRKELLGRSIPWFLVQMFGAGLFLTVLFPLWGIPNPTPIHALLLVGLLLVASLSFGAATARIFVKPLKVAQNLLAFNTPALLFSGYTFPEWAMPSAIEWATRPLPFSLFVDAYRGVSGGMGARAHWGWIGLGLYLAAAFLVFLWPSKIPSSVSLTSEETPTKSEWIRIWKTPGLAMLVVAAPLLYLGIYGGLFSWKEESKIPVGITGSLHSSMDRQFFRALNAHPRMEAVHLEAEEAKSALQAGRIRGILEIPANFGQKIQMRQAIGIPLFIPASRFLPVGDLQRAVNEVLSDFNTRFRQDVFLSRGVASLMVSERANALMMEDHPLFNPKETYGDFMLPGLGILILHQLLFLAMAYATAIAGITVGSLWKRSLLYGIWFGAWVLAWLHIGLPLLEVPINPNYLSFTILSVLGLSCAAFLGVIVGVLLRSGIAVLQLVAFTSYPFFFLSGASWPREAMPGWIDAIGQLLPLRPWMVGAGRSIRMGADCSEVFAEIVHLSALASTYFLLALLLWWLGRRRLAIFSK